LNDLKKCFSVTLALALHIGYLRGKRSNFEPLEKRT